MSRAPRAGESIRLERWHRHAVYAVTGLLVVSGVAWLVLHTWLTQQGEFGEHAHPLEPWMLRVHGAAAMVALALLGSLIPIHVRRAWSIRRNVGLGIALSSLFAVLVVSGYLLYYAGGEETRAVISLLHWTIGLAVPALLAWHVLSGRQRAAGVSLSRGSARDAA